VFARIAVLLLVVGMVSTAHGQSLRGSKASIRRMYAGAKSDGLRFYVTGAAVRAAAKSGKLVRLTSNADVQVDDDVHFPYVRPMTRTFVLRLGAQYRAACGERLVVTSGVRPTRRQPVNSSPRSVHPTGMAVDLRKPDGRCLTWLRRTLLDLEDEGVIEATEEHKPVHFHVAVFLSKYRDYVAARSTTTANGASD
jgi:hypothetical protein